MKDHHECPFAVKTGESFILGGKNGDRGEAFRVVGSKGQLGHILGDLVTVLWSLIKTTTDDN